MDTRDASILTQVAFKAAVDLTVANGGDILQDDTDMYARFEVLKAKLFSEVEASMEAHKPAPQRVPVKQPAAASVESTLATELGAEIYIEVVSKGGQQGPFPAWFLEQAAEKGSTRVYDNRADLADNPNRPWFKDADNSNIAYWPPKPKGGGRK